MKTTQKTFDVKVIKQVASEICTHKFFGNGYFPKKYCIVEISKGLYGLAKLNKRECRILFKDISKVNNTLYLLNLEDNSKVFLKFYGEEEKISVSKRFHEVIKIFQDSALVMDLRGNRQLVGWSWENLFCPTPYMSEWIYNKAENNVIMPIARDNETILLKEGLIIIDKGFRRVLEYVDDIKINNKFRVVIYEDESMTVIRIKDLEESKHFKEIKYISYDNDTYFKNYVEVVLNNNKRAILRISDFKLSEVCDNITYLSSQYVLITQGNTSNIMRLSDFALAQWPKNKKT